MENANESGTAREVMDGMARAFFVSAFADAYDEADASSKKKRKIGNMAGRDFYDVAPKENDPEAESAADELAEKLQTANGVADMADLYHKAMERKELCQGDRDMTPRNFGIYLAMQAMGHGVGLFDAFGGAVHEFVKVPDVEFGMGHLQKSYF